MKALVARLFARVYCNTCGARIRKLERMNTYAGRRTIQKRNLARCILCSQAANHDERSPIRTKVVMV